VRLVKGTRGRGYVCRVNRRTLRIPVGNKRLGGPPILRTPRRSKADSGLRIRVLGAELGEEDRAYIRSKLDLKLGKLAEPIERVSVRVANVDGPRGRIDQRSRIKVVLRGLPSIVVEKQDASLHVAMDDALAEVERAVRRSLRKRQARDLRKPRARGRRRTARAR
jgi:putative sigma-54 modulation protein